MVNPRTIWNGAISFGLVNIPVGLYTATHDSGLDFDWLDKRSMDPVGYKRINKRTGLEIDKDQIVKGIAYGKGQYVLISEEEIKDALAKSTQTIEIESFVSVSEISPLFFQQPYYLAPQEKAEKAYTLLRETLLHSQRVGIARVVIHSKQHLAAIIPQGQLLALILLRWAEQIRPWRELNLPAADSSGLAEKELLMARQLIDAMTEAWQPDRYHDSFTAKVMALVAEKAETGRIETVLPAEAVPAGEDLAEVIDFTELLRRSLQEKVPGQKKPSKRRISGQRAAEGRSPKKKAE